MHYFGAILAILIPVIVGTNYIALPTILLEKRILQERKGEIEGQL